MSKQSLMRALTDALLDSEARDTLLTEPRRVSAQYELSRSESNLIRRDLDDLIELACGDLTLVAMKLGIMDPLNDPENLNKLIVANNSLSEIGGRVADYHTQMQDERARAEESRHCAELIRTVTQIVLALMMLLILLRAFSERE